MDYVLKRFRVKPGCEDEFRRAVREHFARRDEVSDGLRSAGVDLECAYEHETSEGLAFFVFKRVADEASALAHLAQSEHAADTSAKDLMSRWLLEEETLTPVALFDLT